MPIIKGTTDRTSSLSTGVRTGETFGALTHEHPFLYAHLDQSHHLQLSKPLTMQRDIRQTSIIRLAGVRKRADMELVAYYSQTRGSGQTTKLLK
jgi:hypothetical protein